MQKKIPCILLILIVSIVFGYSFLLVTNSFIVPKIVLNNEIHFKLLFESENEVISFNLYDENNRLAQNLEFMVEEANVEQSVNVMLPFLNSHRLEVVFGDNKNIVRIDEFSINSKNVDLKKFADTVHDQGHIVGFDKNSSAIYIKSKGSDHPIELNNLDYEIIKISVKELEELSASEQFLLNVYLFLLFVLSFSLLLILWRCDKNQGTKWMLSAVSFIFVFILLSANYLQCLLYISSIDNGNYSNNLIKFLQNNVLVFIPLSVFFYLAVTVKKTVLKFVNIFIFFLLFFILCLDSGVNQSLGVRYIFRLSGEYLLDFDTALSFVLGFLHSKVGVLYASVLLLSIVALFVLHYFYKNSQIKFNFFNLIFAFPLVFIISLPSEESKNDFYFANVFQINGFTFKSLGDYTKSYSDNFGLAKNLDFGWETKKGLNKQQNVIILLVESLNCELTKMCRNSNLELMPNLTEYAKKYALFDNYYSNNYSTSSAYLTITKGIPIFPTKTRNFITLNPLLSKIFDKNDLPHLFKEQGYSTKFFSSTDLVFEMDRYVEFSKYDEVIDSKHKIFNNFDKKYLFNSVSDDDLLQQIAESARNESSKFYYVTKTASSHAPFNSPWGENDFENSFKYTDYAIDRFIKTLEKNGYFENGILIITGDHQPWSYGSGANLDDSVMFKNHVPLLIIGNEFKSKVNHTFFSHSSLGIYIQSLMLPRYTKNIFQADPIRGDDPEVILYYNFAKQHFAIVKVSDVESEIRIDGDKSEFLDKNLPDDLQNQILGFLAWIHL